MLRVEEIFELLYKQYPDPKTELEYTNHFTLLVAIILSAQSTDKGVNKATRKLFELVSSPADILALGEEKLIEYIKTIGLYKTKAKNIIGMCQLLIDEYNGLVPGEFSQLIKLPGVGRKTANVFLNCALGQETIAVDTHVFRVGNRLGIACGKNPLEVEKAFLEIVPKRFLQIAHHLLILHGRYVCKALKPKCSECVINQYCDFYQAQNNILLP